MDPSTRLRRILLVTLSILMSFGGLLWGTIATSVGAHLQSTIPYGYVVATFLNLSLFRAHRNFFVTSQVQLSLSLLLPFLFQWSLGGGRASGAMMLWGVLALVGAILVRAGRAIVWIISFIILAALSLALEPYLQPRFTLLDEGQQVFALTLNVCIIMAIVFGLMVYFIRKLDYSEYLETLVVQRTREVQTQLETTRSLLNGLKQAVFSIDKTGIVVPPVSAAARKVLGIDIEHRSLVDSVVESVPSLRGRRQSLEDMIKAVFTFDPDQWATVEEQLPRVIQYKGLNFQTEQSLRMHYSPLWGEDGQLNKIIFVAENITDVLQLEKAVELEKKDAERRARAVQEIASNSINELQSFFRKYSSSRQSLETILGSSDRSTETFKVAVQILHRLKGESQILKLNLLAGELHRLESSFVSKKDQWSAQEKTWEELIVLAQYELSTLEQLVRIYYEVASRLLNISLSSESGGPSLLRLDLSVEGLRKLKRTLQNAQVSGPDGLAEQAQRDFDELIGQSLESAVESLGQVVDEVAERSGKKAKLLVSADGVKVSPLLVGSLKEVLLHLVRNSIDHGIEHPEERKRSGKEEVGRIRISASRTSGKLWITLKDDGRGIKTAALIEKAIHQGFLSAEDSVRLDERAKLDLIFMKALSTNERATEYSGRGMGMDIVREILQGLSGSIHVSSKPDEWTEFKIEIPEHPLAAR